MTCFEAIDVMGEAVEDRLAADRRAALGDHLAECRPCRTYFEHLRVTRAALRGLPSGAGTSPRRDDLIAEFRREFERN
jgi:anti-sigma factor RsiW